MKTSCVVCVTLALSIFMVIEALPQKKGAKWDNIDLDSVLSNGRVTTSYINCLLDKGPCTPEGRDLRESIPHSLDTLCKECSANQKALVRKASRFVIKNRPEDWEKLTSKYDPSGQKSQQFMEFIQSDD